MNTHARVRSVLKLGFLLAVMLCASPVQANPIALPEKPVTAPLTFTITISILLEAICWFLCPRRFRKPRLFILWILGMHLITFPAFVGLLRCLDTLRPAVAVTFGEGLVILVEGFLVFLLCNFVANASQNSPGPSLVRCWLVSLAANFCSVVAFPLLTSASDRFGW
jgi:hypothetical protein